MIRHHRFSMHLNQLLPMLLPKISFRILVLVCFILLSVVACKSDDTYSFDPTPYLPKYDSFLKEDRAWIHRNDKRPGYLAEIKRRDSVFKKLKRAAGLDILDTGYNDLQITFTYSMDNDGWYQSFSLKRTPNKWSASINIWKDDYDFVKVPGKDMLQPVNPHVSAFRTNEVKPKSNWETVFRKLNDLQIFTLPDFNNIPDFYREQANSDGYEIEIGTKNMYREYSYYLLKDNKKFWQVRNIIEITDFLEKEFGFEKIKHDSPNAKPN